MPKVIHCFLGFDHAVLDKKCSIGGPDFQDNAHNFDVGHTHFELSLRYLSRHHKYTSLITEDKGLDLRFAFESCVYTGVSYAHEL